MKGEGVVEMFVIENKSIIMVIKTLLNGYLLNIILWRGCSCCIQMILIIILSKLFFTFFIVYEYITAEVRFIVSIILHI